MKEVPKKITLTHLEVIQKVSFIPESQTQEIQPGLEVTITPIDATSMNEISRRATGFDGNYDNSYSSTYLKEESINIGSELTKSQKREIKDQRQIIDFVKEKVRNGEIPESVGDALNSKILSENIGVTGEEYTQQSVEGRFNPYRVDKRYLSVFQLTLKNTGNTIVKVKQKDFIVSSGSEQLEPLRTEYFEGLFIMDQRLLMNVYRLNMPDELIVPPTETIIKYVSVPSINLNTEILTVRIIQNELVKSYNYVVDVEERIEETVLEKITFKANKDWSLDVESYYFVLTLPNGQIQILRKNEIFISEEFKKSPFSVYGIARSQDGFHFVKKDNVVVEKNSSNVIELLFGEKQYFDSF